MKPLFPFHLKLCVHELPSKVLDCIHRYQMVGKPPQKLPCANILSQRIYTKSKLSTEMPQLHIYEKGPSKRRSTTAMREDDECRKKVAHEPEEEEEEEEEMIDMSNMMAEIKEIAEARRKTEKQARDDGMRVEKKARMRPRPHCCACGKQPGVKHNGTCSCGHSRCPEYIILK